MRTLPEYVVRPSSRARRVRLTVGATTGLEIVVPHGFDLDQIPRLLEDHRAWIERTMARWEARREQIYADRSGLPSSISLRALGEEWEVEYRPSGPRVGELRGPGVAARERPGRRLVVDGSAEDLQTCRDALRRWLTRRARRTLLPRLRALSVEHGLDYAQASVRQQRTRWGSCSPKKTISLNARLLFLPREVVDYVLLHELCHTIEMSHSQRFWGLVREHDPDFSLHKKQLREARMTLPSWLDGAATQPKE